MRSRYLKIINHIEIRDGKGYIKGRNIKAEMVARLHVLEKSSIKEVAQQYDLSPAEVQSAIAFYYDNQEQLDAEYRKALELAQEIGTSFDDFQEKIKKRRNRDE